MPRYELLFVCVFGDEPDVRLHFEAQSICAAAAFAEYADRILTDSGSTYRCTRVMPVFDAPVQTLIKKEEKRMNIISGPVFTPQRVVIYGPEGVGKSTLAAAFPDPIFIDTEGGTAQLNVRRFDRPQSWEDLITQVRYAAAHSGELKTLVIDTADWAEKLCALSVCRENGYKSIETFDFGKGYVYLAERFAELLRELDKARGAGLTTVITAHAKMRKIEQPEQEGAYDHWEMKLTKQCAPLLKEWCDMLLFCNYRTTVYKPDGKNGKAKAVGGRERVLYTCHTAGWDAKNRHGLPEELPMTFDAIAAAVLPPANAASPTVTAVHRAPPPTALPQAQPGDSMQALEAALEDAGVPVERPAERIPPELRALMNRDGVSLPDLEAIVTHKGFFPPGTAFKDYPPDFVQKGLIAGWDQMIAYGRRAGILSEVEDLPF